MILWGVIAVVTGLVQSSSELIILRFLLGIVEAGFFPGMIWYLGTWFPQWYLARSIALFSTAIVISNIIGVPLSMYIVDTVNWGSIVSWRWPFILEGIPAILLGIVSFWVLGNGPADTRWLDSAHKEYLL